MWSKDSPTGLPIAPHAAAIPKTQLTCLAMTLLKTDHAPSGCCFPPLTYLHTYLLTYFTYLLSYLLTYLLYLLTYLLAYFTNSLTHHLGFASRHRRKDEAGAIA